MFSRYTRVSQARAGHLLTQLQAGHDAQARAVILTERTRLAREVHDILAHSLSGLVLTLATAGLLGRHGEASPESQAKILEQVARARRIARDGRADTRRAVSAPRRLRAARRRAAETRTAGAPGPGHLGDSGHPRVPD
jgi:signal transduction histidine kinase